MYSVFKNKDKNYIFLNTKGTCLLCYGDCPVSHEKQQRSKETSINFCKLISRYLGFDLTKSIVTPLKMMRKGSDKLENDVSIELCDRCATLANAFCQVHFQLQFNQMILDRCLRTISEILREADVKARDAVFSLSNEKIYPTLRERRTFTRHTLGNFKSAHNLRSNINQRCLTKLKTSLPIVKLKRISKDNQSTLPNDEKRPLPFGSEFEMMMASLLGCVISFWIVLSLSFIDATEITPVSKTPPFDEVVQDDSPQKISGLVNIQPKNEAVKLEIPKPEVAPSTTTAQMPIAASQTYSTPTTYEPLCNRTQSVIQSISNVPNSYTYSTSTTAAYSEGQGATINYNYNSSAQNHQPYQQSYPTSWNSTAYEQASATTNNTAQDPCTSMATASSTYNDNYSSSDASSYPYYNNYSYTANGSTNYNYNYNYNFNTYVETGSNVSEYAPSQNQVQTYQSSSGTAEYHQVPPEPTTVYNGSTESSSYSQPYTNDVAVYPETSKQNASDESYEPNLACAYQAAEEPQLVAEEQQLQFELMATEDENVESPGSQQQGGVVIFPELHWRSQKAMPTKRCSHHGCTEAFLSEAQLSLHLKSHGSFKCNFCHLTFGKAHNLAFHEKMRHSKGTSSSKTNKCSRCSFCSDSQYKYFLHFLSEHLQISVCDRKCNVCQHGFVAGTGAIVLKMHFKNYHNVEGKDPESIHTCTHCNAPFLKMQQLIKHAQSIHNVVIKSK